MPLGYAAKVFVHAGDIDIDGYIAKRRTKHSTTNSTVVSIYYQVRKV